MIAYFTNIWNHYQAPLGRELASYFGDEFKMVITRPSEEPNGKRSQLGWDLQCPNEKWLIKPPRYFEELSTGPWLPILEESDVCLIGNLEGGRPVIEALKRRIKSGKLTFIVGERYFKERFRLKDYLNVKLWMRLFRLHQMYNHKNVHYLTISHYFPSDLKLLRIARGRMWRWAYFPPLSKEEPKKPKNDKLELGWCGRMLGWKNVDLTIEALSILPNNVRKQCHLTIVGGGPEEDRLRALTSYLKLEDCITFEGVKSPDEIREFMRSWDVYLFPSQREEGWGVVLAEAMDSGCVAIAGELAGSTPDLIDDGENGFVIPPNDIVKMADSIAWLANNRDACRNIGIKAWRKIRMIDARAAVERLSKLITAIQAGNCSTLFTSGLCTNVG